MEKVANRIRNIGFVIVVLLACVSYCTAVLPPDDETGSIDVTSEPSGATIGLETSAGPFVGPSIKTPYTFTKVEPGTCTVKLSLEGYRDWSETNEVKAGSTLHVHAKLTPEKTTGSISVSSSPSGANVYLDNAYKGLTPLTISDVSHGHYNIELTLDGYQNWYGTTEVNAGETSYVSATLTPTPPATGSISVSSSPSGARTYVDGSYNGRTPETINGLSPGTHTVKLKLDGYYTWEKSNIQVTAGGTSYVSASLTQIPYPSVGSISVSSTPSGANIYLDGHYSGKTQKTITGVSPGTHTIEIERSGYYDWTNPVRVKAGSTSHISASLNPNPSPTTGTIAVSSTPTGANIYLDGAYQGRTSASGDFVIVAVAPGHYTVSLELSGYRNWEAGVDVTVGGTAHVSAKLVPTSSPSPTTGTISVSSSPSGANIYLDNAYKGLAPITITDVSPGTHTIEAKLESYQDWSTSVQVLAGDTASVSASLTPSTAPTPKSPTTVLGVIAALIITGFIAAKKRR